MTASLLDETEVSTQTDAIAASLALRGVTPGDVVALIAGNTPFHVAARDAAARLDAILAPINPRLAAREIDDLVALSAAKAVLREDDVLPAVAATRTAPTVGATLLFTSGTTGGPKGCLRTAAQERARIEELVATYGITSADTHLIVCPLAHSAPGSLLRAARSVGARTVLLPRFDAHAFLEAARDATVVFLVPTQVARLLALPEEARVRLPSLRVCIVAGAPFAQSAKERLCGWLPGRVWEFLGSSETGTISVVPPAAEPAPPGCVGWPPPGVEVQLLDEAGAEVALGQVGELYVRSPSVMERYLGGPPVDGLFSVGDLARRAIDGSLVLVDRKHDTIITGGVNVQPAEIERALLEQPGVLGAVVCGVPDPDWGEAVCALVAVERDLSAAALAEQLRTRLAPFKLPKRRRFVALDELPIGDSGKPLRRAARAFFP